MFSIATLLAKAGLGPSTPPSGPPPSGDLSTATSMVVDGAKAFMPIAPPPAAAVSSGTNYTPYVVGAVVIGGLWLILRGRK